MSTSAPDTLIEPAASTVSVTDDALVVDLNDGRTIIAPLAWYPRLWHGTPDERRDVEIIGDGLYLHWPRLDEDLSVSGILAGRPSGESDASFQRWLATRRRAG